MDALFFLNSTLMGFGLAVDAFSVSVANAIVEPVMGRRRMDLMAGVYAGFQFLMPLAGWFCVRRIVEAFTAVSGTIPWIALLLLSLIGGKMILEGLRPGEEREEGRGRIGMGTLLLQGVATSIDALSVGFTIASYRAAEACLCAAVIAAVTFALCRTGLVIGKKIGEKTEGRTRIVGGCVLIGIGIEILLKGLL